MFRRLRMAKISVTQEEGPFTLKDLINNMNTLAHWKLHKPQNIHKR